MIKNVLIVHTGAIGDFILTWPALIRLKRAGYYLTAILPSRSLRLSLRFGLIDNGLDLESREALPFFSGDSLPDGIKADRAILWLHRDERLIRMLEVAGLHTPVFVNPKPDGMIHTARSHIEAVRNVFPVEPPDDLLLGFPDSRPVGRTALIHPGSGGVEKRFSPGFHRKLGESLRRLGFQTDFLLGPVELDSPLGDFFQDESVIRSTNVDDLVDQLDRSGLFIGNDSGPSHLSGFMGIPSISLFRSTDLAVWGALGRRVSHLKGVDEPEMLKSVERKVMEWKEDARNVSGKSVSG